MGILAGFSNRKAQQETGFEITPSKDETPNAFVIKTDYGYIDYVHKPDDDVNEIWWVESSKSGHGSELVDLMQQHHPAGNIAWGVTSQSGLGLAEKWHKNNPDVYMIEGPHEGQFDPF